MEPGPMNRARDLVTWAYVAGMTGIVLLVYCVGGWLTARGRQDGD